MFTFLFNMLFNLVKRAVAYTIITIFVVIVGLFTLFYIIPAGISTLF